MNGFTNYELFGWTKSLKVADWISRMCFWETDKPESAEIGHRPTFLKKKFVFREGDKVAGNLSGRILITSECVLRS